MQNKSAETTCFIHFNTASNRVEVTLLPEFNVAIQGMHMLSSIQIRVTSNYLPNEVEMIHGNFAQT